MTFSWAKLVAFAVFGAVGLAFLAWQDRPVADQVLDRHSGAPLDEDGEPTGPWGPMTPKRILAEAVELGSAGWSLDLLRVRREEIRDPSALDHATGRIEAELLTAEEMRQRDLLDAGSAARFERARRLVDGGFLEGTPPEAALATLRDLEIDDDVAVSTEAFFRPITAGRSSTEDEFAASEADPVRPDRLAAFVLHAVRGDPDRVDAATALRVADAFRRAGRARARLRWLHRAVAASPGSPESGTALASAYSDAGRLHEALYALDASSAAGANDVDLWRLRAKLAVWQGKPELEAESLRWVLRHESDGEVRRRLVELLRYLGRGDEAVPHVVRLAEDEGTEASFGWASNVALESGDVDEGLRLLDRAIEVSEAPIPWREKRLEILIQDLRQDDAIAELRALDAENPGQGYDRWLEGLLRRRNRMHDLADLLEERYEREPTPELERELLGLVVQLGRTGGLRRILTHRMERDDARSLFENLPHYRAAGLPGLARRLAEIVQSPDIRAEDAPGYLDALAASLEEPGFRWAARTLSERFLEIPECRELRVYLLDQAETPEDAAREAEELAFAHAESDELLRVWADRAAWAGLGEDELRARRRIVRRNPDEMEDRRRLAELLEATDRYEAAIDQWIVLADAEGPGSDAEIRLIDALRGTGRTQEALERLARRVGDRDLTPAERIDLAGHFFEAHWLDLAQKLYLEVLEEEPDHPVALLRVGQILAWGEDAGGSEPYLQRLIDVHGPGDGEALYLLSEARWASGREDEARALCADALPLLRADPRTPPHDSMTAKTLSRLGRVDEAEVLYQRLVEGDPGNADLLLDFADAMLVVGRVEKARALVDRAGELDPGTRRWLRLNGHVLLAERRYEAAIDAFVEGIEEYGADAGFYADLGEALGIAGHWANARDALDHALELSPGSGVARTRRTYADLLASPLLEAEIHARSVAEDSVVELATWGSMLLDDDRIRLSAILEHGRYSGRAQVASDEDLDSDLTSLGAGIDTRLGRTWSVGGGLDFHLRESSHLGAWAEVAWRDREPFRQVGLRVFGGSPMRAPAAAMALDGRSDGLTAEGQIVLGDTPLWFGGRVDGRQLTITTEEEGSVSNPHLLLEVLFGVRFLEDGPDVLDSIRRRRVPSVLEGMTIAGEPAAMRGPSLGAWLGLTSTRLLGDARLADLLPIGERHDYLTATARAEGRLADGLLGEAEVFLGTDLANPGLLSGATLGLAWRPGPGTELRLRGSYGTDLIRDDGASSIELGLVLVLRW